MNTTDYTAIFSQNRLCQLLGIKIPIIQAGMVWCSGWKLATAVSEVGGLGVIGAGSMDLDTLRHHIRSCKGNTTRPFAVNTPLLYSHIADVMQVLIEEKVPIVITSAGNPTIWTNKLKEHSIKVLHVVSSTSFALKAEQAGVDAIVAEGFEAGGHNGREETTSFCLIPAVSEAVAVPVVAAGGMFDGKTMLAAFALGAEGIQIGTRFAASIESSAHEKFKQYIIGLKEGSTVLTLKALTPVRMAKNEFYEQVKIQEQQGANTEIFRNLLGKGRSRKGIFEGNLQEGELEIGQVAARLYKIEPAADIVKEICKEYAERKALL